MANVVYSNDKRIEIVYPNLTHSGGGGNFRYDNVSNIDDNH